MALVRTGRSDDQALRLTLSRHQGGPQPALLVARRMATQMGLPVQAASEGVCPAGEYGRVSFASPQFGHGEIWVVSDKVHAFIAAYSCDPAPSAEELEEIAGMVKSVSWSAA